MKFQVGVVGRGIAGLTAARRLVEAGKSVCLIGPRAKQGAASVAAIGMNVMRGVRNARDPLHEIKELAYHRMQQWIRCLETESQHPIPHQFDSIYEPLFSSAELLKFEQRDAHLRRTEMRACSIYALDRAPAELPEILSKTGKELAGFIEYPGDGWFAVEELLKAMELILRRHCARIVDEDVEDILPSTDSGWNLSTSTGETISCEEMVLACGVFAEPFLSNLGIVLPFRRVGGMMLEVESPQLGNGILLSRRKNFVSHGGRSWIGALDFKNVESCSLSEEDAQFGLRQLLEIARNNFGDIGTGDFSRRGRIKPFYGVRSYFKDRMPAVGELVVPAENRRLYLSLGYHKNGLQIADICAENLVKLMHGQADDSLFHSFSPKRLLN